MGRNLYVADKVWVAPDVELVVRHSMAGDKFAVTIIIIAGLSYAIEKKKIDDEVG